MIYSWLLPPYVLHMGVRSAMNKRKQTMIYSWLLPANVVDTIFGVAGLSDNSFRKAGKERARELSSSPAVRQPSSFFLLGAAAAWRCCCVRGFPSIVRLHAFI
jgi:hypothetical protein